MTIIYSSSIVFFGWTDDDAIKLYKLITGKPFDKTITESGDKSSGESSDECNNGTDSETSINKNLSKYGLKASVLYEQFKKKNIFYIHFGNKIKTSLAGDDDPYVTDNEMSLLQINEYITKWKELFSKFKNKKLPIPSVKILMEFVYE